MLKGAAAAAMRTGAGRAAAYGGLAGAGWGMMSSDTSVIGGALMGATAGLGLRYGKFGARAAMRANSFGYQMGPAFTGAVDRRFMRDFRGGVIAANRGYNRIRSSMRGWSTGLGAGI